MTHDPSAPQRLASDPRVSAWVGANAGSGKTRVLTQRVARLLLAGAEPGRILCLTYTKAAAAEMQSRLFALLGAWSMQPDDKLAEMLGALAGEGPVQAPERLAIARRLFARALETPGGLKIQTIHAFCDALLRRFPLEAGVAPGFEVIDERQSALLLDQIRDQLAWAAEDGTDPAFDGVAGRLNEGAVEEIMRAILSRRAGFEGADAEALLRRHLGDEVDQPLAELAAAHLDGNRDRIAFLARVFAEGGVNEKKTAVKLDRALSQMDQDPVACAKRVIDAVLVQSGDRRGLPRKNHPTKPIAAAHPAAASEFNALSEMAMELDDALTRAESAARARDLHRFARALLAAYGDAKSRRSLLDFDDLITRARGLLTQSEMRAWVLYKLDQGIDHVLVDEAQDTAPQQWEVIAAITDDFHAGETRAPSGGLARSVFVVGDEKQSIYSFQGAEPWAFGEMRQRYATRIAEIDGKLERPGLITSFRSAPAILRFVDAVFDGEEAKGVTYTGDPIEHRAYREDPARIDLWPLVEAEPLPDRPHWKEPVDLPPPDDPKRRLARLMAGEIRRMVEEERLPSRGKDGPRPVRPGDILVLVRKRDDLARALIQNLKSLGVPVAGADRLTLAEELAVKDLLSLIRAVLNRDDELALAEVLRSPLCNVDEAALFELAHWRKESLWHAVMGAAAHARDAAMLSDLAGKAGFLPPYEFLERVLTHHDGRRRLVARLGPEAEDPIDEILAQALTFETRETPSLHGFLAWIEAGDIALKREMEKGAGEVRVMTIHGAKGLEAPIVILPDTMAQTRGRSPILPTVHQAGERLMLWPGAAATDDVVTEAARKEAAAREAAEAKRLLYVGLTRAEDWLILAGAGDQEAAGERWYGTLEAAFDRLEADQTVGLGEEFSARRIADGEWPEAAPGTTGATPDPLGEAPHWLATAPREARPRRLTPSHLATAPAPAKQGTLEPGLARLRGEAVHLLLERLPDAAAPSRAMFAPRLIAEALSELPLPLVDEAIAEAFSVLEDPDLAWIFGPSSVGEVAVSLPIDLPGALALHGRIDRLIVTDERLTIVDFKSDQVPPDNPQDVSPGYLAQLGAYGAVLAGLYPDRAIETGLLWTRTRRFMALAPDAVETAYHEAVGGIDLGAGAS